MPQSALLLGSGFVATPAVQILSDAGVHVTVACRTLASAQKLAGNFANTKAVSLDVNDTSALEDATAKHDLIISLIPYTYHIAVVKAAIKAKKNVVTTSYVSPAMQALDEEVKAAGITVMNEIGLDPGYNVPEAQTVMRGTLRYAGFPEFIKVLIDIGFLSEEELNFLKEPIVWKEATKKILGATSSSENDLVWAISSKTTFKNTDEKNRLVAGLKWLGIFSELKITPKGNPLDTLCAALEEKMTYEEGERDFVFLQHNFEIENKDGSKDIVTSTLCEYGSPIGSGGYLAMEKLVGIPCGVGKSSSFATIFGSSVLPSALLSISPSLITLSIA
ncbi:MAG: hypothetical protein Q9167_003906 [Letrouitia subvulpina]